MAMTVGCPFVKVTASIYESRSDEEREEFDAWCLLHDLPIGERWGIRFMPEGPVQAETLEKGLHDVDMKAIPPRWVLGLWQPTS